jgi:hypothetical protein
VYQALAAEQGTLNKFLVSAFPGFVYGEECQEAQKCIEWTVTYAQVRSL